MINEKTQTRDYPLPHPDNIMQDDVNRVRETFNKVDSDIHSLRLENILKGDAGNDGHSPNGPNPSGTGIWWPA